ncbi:YoaK family protein [Perlucidibaca piscinae]|uniref:YoaK family protein n=1 Tax=Perlucidibaca piscinae TaxID=392589 RepID=UPI0003B5A9BA|nr:YoaK family protein [Perlucidibaca piscinae]
MIKRMPRWILLGAWLLACIAGMINVVGFMGLEQHAITHLTGTSTLLGAAIAQGRGGLALELAGAILAFLLGALLSGLIIRNTSLSLGRHYNAVLALEAGLLVLAVPLLERHSLSGLYVAATACGLQNAMATTYSGAVIRTTHLSGMVTDLGLLLGQLLRGIVIERRRLAVCLTVISGFLIGSLIGALLFSWLQFRTLLVPAALTGVTALAYGAYLSRHGHRNEHGSSR